MDEAVELQMNWIKKQNIPGLTVELLKEKGRTPVIFMTVPGSNNTTETVFLYGHADVSSTTQHELRHKLRTE